MRANRIEVTQIADRPTVVGPAEILQHLFDNELCAAVRIGRAERMLFVERQVSRYPVDGRGRAEDQRLYIRSLHGRHEPHRTQDVVLVIRHGPYVGIAHRLQPCEVNDRSHSEGAKYFTDRLFIPDIGEPKDERTPADGLHPLERSLVAVGEIVDGDDVKPGVQQRDTDVGPDVAGTSGHQDHVGRLPHSHNRHPCIAPPHYLQVAPMRRGDFGL